LQAEVDRLLAGDARADEDGFLRVPDALSSTQDQVCDRFGATWRAGERPQIAANPPPEIPGYETLSGKIRCQFIISEKSGVSSSFRKNDELTPDFPDENLSG